MSSARRRRQGLVPQKEVLNGKWRRSVPSIICRISTGAPGGNDVVGGAMAGAMAGGAMGVGMAVPTGCSTGCGASVTVENECVRPSSIARGMSDASRGGSIPGSASETGSASAASAGATGPTQEVGVGIIAGAARGADSLVECWEKGSQLHPPWDAADSCTCMLGALVGAVMGAMAWIMSVAAVGSAMGAVG